jgi:hypothetical protein
MQDIQATVYAACVAIRDCIKWQPMPCHPRHQRRAPAVHDAAPLGSEKTIFNIVQKDLNLEAKSAKWAPKLLNDDQK